MCMLTLVDIAATQYINVFDTTLLFLRILYIMLVN